MSLSSYYNTFQRWLKTGGPTLREAVRLRSDAIEYWNQLAGEIERDRVERHKYNSDLVNTRPLKVPRVAGDLDTEYSGSVSTDVVEAGAPSVVRRKMYRSRGVIQPKFTRARKLKRVRPHAYLKLEFGGVRNAWNCAYVGHCTHPASQTWYMISLALLHKYLKDCGCTPQYFREKMGDPDSLVTSALKVEIQWFAGQIATKNKLVVDYNTNYSIEAWACVVADKMVDAFGVAGSRDVQVSLIKFKVDPNIVTESLLETKYYHGADMLITVTGKSVMQLQNRTLGDVGDSATVDSIGANPVRGKQYEIVGDALSLREQFSSGGGLIEFVCEPFYGSFASGDRVGTSPGITIWGKVEPQMRKPPGSSLFKYVTAQKYVTMEPGGIRKSVVSHTVTKSLNAWIAAFAELFVQAKSNVPVDPRTFDMGNGARRLPCGRMRVFALEKMCDTSVAEGDEIAIGQEIVLNMSSYITFKKHRSVAPVVNNQILLSGPPDPTG